MFEIKIKLNSAIIDQSLFATEAEALEWYEINKSKYDQSHSKEIKNLTKIIERKAKQDFGALFMAEVLELVDRKVLAGELSQGDLIAMESSADLMLIEKCAWRGMIDTLKGLVTNYTGIYYTQADKDYLLALITNAGF